jgi:hypothetical protein
MMFPTPVLQAKTAVALHLTPLPLSNVEWEKLLQRFVSVIASGLIDQFISFYPQGTENGVFHQDVVVGWRGKTGAARFVVTNRPTVIQFDSVKVTPLSVKSSNTNPSNGLVASAHSM